MRLKKTAFLEIILKPFSETGRTPKQIKNDFAQLLKLNSTKSQIKTETKQ